MGIWSIEIGKGYLYFVSRVDDMIKTNGYRVVPREIEDVVYRYFKEIGEVVAGLWNSNEDIEEEIVWSIVPIKKYPKMRYSLNSNATWNLHDTLHS